MAKVQKHCKIHRVFSKVFNASQQAGDITGIPKLTTKLMNEVSSSFMLSSWKYELKPSKMKASISTVANILGIEICIELSGIFQRQKALLAHSEKTNRRIKQFLQTLSLDSFSAEKQHTTKTQ